MKVESYACDKCGVSLKKSEAFMLYLFDHTLRRGDRSIHDGCLCASCAERLRKSLPFLGGRQ